MLKIPEKIEAWRMVEPGKLAMASLPVPELKPGEVLVEVAGCGVCHTDLSYFAHGVKTVVPPPITLGHEISGTVIAGDRELVGKEVIIPAVMPCNNCPICAAGRGNRCLGQKMPGNSLGDMGGFASHIVVPGHDLCVINDRGNVPLPTLAVLADAITTPYQAATKADVKPGDLTIVIGATGGVGTYMTQVLTAMGAQAVVGIGRNAEKLERARSLGATTVINSKGKSAKDVRTEFRDICKANNWPSNFGWKIFECTGTGDGQEIGLEMLSFIGKLIIVGFGTVVNQYSLSRLMAFDAEIIGSWGCPPKYYPTVLEMVLSGQIAVEPLVEVRPMSQIEEVFQLADRGDLFKRVVLTPDF
ncbi:MAG: 6-hydroxycyclohex-1-ene-1-carbonyl-CoA dehydrogenase [Chloroflexi bacterium]|nr:6-hydroxycyclohex-1-ene-1-carbonyl-CoA dehydrogenase [Chloroflexota bacterium]